MRRHKQARPKTRSLKASSFRVLPSWVRFLPAVFRSSPTRAAALLAATVAAAALPNLMVLTSAAVVEAAPAAVAEGSPSEAWTQHGVALALYLGLYSLSHVMDVLPPALSSSLSMRFSHHVHFRVADATLRAPLLVVESPEFQSLVHTTIRTPAGGSPGEFVLALQPAGTVALTSASALLLIGGYSPMAAALLAMSILVSGRRAKAVLTEMFEQANADVDELRHAAYVQGLPLDRGHAKEVLLFRLADWAAESFMAAWLAFYEKVWRRRRTAVINASLLRALPAAGGALTLVLLFRDAIGGRVGAPTVVLVIGVLIVLMRNQGSFVVYSLQGGASCLAALEQLEIATWGTTSGLPDAEPPQREIRFEGVCFSYPGRETPVLNGLDLAITAGTSLALVGENGAGKSTFVKLLCGLYEPDCGRITVDGRKLGAVDTRTWRRLVAPVFQNFASWPLTARENVGFGCPSAMGDQQRLEAAAEKAGARETIEALANGWDTVLSAAFEGGTDLSGGEWQRVALARALFAAKAGAAVLVLDEPTSQLDARQEAKFFDRFLEIVRGRTTVVISHRFSTVRRADRIAVLEGGRVVEQGSHQELMDLSGRYRRMFDLQASWFRPAAKDGSDTA